MKNVKGILYRGKYDHPLKMWFSMVPESNIYIMIKEEFKTESTWAKLRSFLNMSQNITYKNVKLPKSYRNVIKNETYAWLQNKYRIPTFRLCEFVLKIHNYKCPQWATNLNNISS